MTAWTAKMQDSSQDTNNGISDIYHTHANTQTNKTLTILLYGYNSTRTLIDCFLVITTHYFVLNNRALLARCPRCPCGHPCYSQLTAVKKGICWPGSPDCITRSSVRLIEVRCFFKVIRWPVVGFNWSQAQVNNEKTI